MMKSAHRLLQFRLLLVVALVLGGVTVGGVPISAQTGTVASTATPSDAAPEVGDTITVTINIDMTGVDAPDNYLGGFTGTLAWDPAILDYVGNDGLPAGFTGVVNETNVDAGTITFNGANAAGATGDVVVLTITFDVVGTGTTALDLEYSAMAAATTFTDLVPILTVNDGTVTVGGGDTYELFIWVVPTAGGTTDPAAGVAHAYPAGTDVTITATPNSGYQFDSWANACTGTGTCEVTMDGDKTVTAVFTEISSTCYALTLTHTGTGSDPVADPANSTGCPTGQYVEDAIIGLTASPGAGWTVGSWTGTDNNSSTSTINQVTMPAAPRTAGVTYVEPSGSVTSSATPDDATPDVGEQVVVTINIDVSGLTPSGTALGSYTGSLDWDPAMLAYNSHSGAPPAGFSGSVNTAGAASGHITFNGANSGGATGNIIAINITFDVVAGGHCTLDLEYSAMAAATCFADLMPLLTTTDGSVSSGPTAVTLASLEALPGAGSIIVAWETASEIDTLGFNILRSTSLAGTYSQLNGTLISSQAPGSPGGAAYSWNDQNVESGVNYYYKLEVLDADGSHTLYGPVQATLSPLRRLLPARPRPLPQAPVLEAR